MWSVRKDQKLNFLPRIIDSGKKNEKEVNVVDVAGKKNIFLHSILDTLESEMIAKRKGKYISSGRAQNATQNIWNCCHSEST